ncbi:hypothetical protein [Planomonospora sp. ID82291]|nr:hypothetical protein [Planomonospora sp. ID82291]
MTTADTGSGPRAGVKQRLGLGVLVLPPLLLFMMKRTSPQPAL